VAGLDVHKAMIVACVRIMADGKPNRTCRTYDTTTDGLKSLLAWLTEQRCTHVAMEATGVYWKPVWNILSEGAFELLVANAAHIKNVPGRKTDVNDATWIANLLACGLIRGSFVPSEEIQQLRALLRARKQLTREQTSHTQRIQKTLEEANVKLDTVISEILGVSGRRMIEAMIAGVTSPQKLMWTAPEAASPVRFAEAGPPPISAVSLVRNPLATRPPEDLRYDRAAPARHRALPPSRCSRGWRAVCPTTPETGPAGSPASEPRQPTVPVDCADRRAGDIGPPPAVSPAHPR